jgi:hypothetical protein
VHFGHGKISVGMNAEDEHCLPVKKYAEMITKMFEVSRQVKSMRQVKVVIS